MSRLLPHPGVAALLFVTWLLLAGSTDLVQLALAGVLALLGGVAYARLGPNPRLHGGRWLAMARLFLRVAMDVTRSNVAVARIVLRPHSPSRRAGFLAIPLEVRHPGALAVLAIIVTATPGTTWAGYDAARSVLTLHVLDLRDEAGLIATIKGRYERPLREIFE